MQIDIRKDYKLTGKVSKVRLAVRDYKADFKTLNKEETKSEAAKLGHRFKKLVPDIVDYMNLVLEEGMELPLPGWLTKLTT